MPDDISDIASYYNGDTASEHRRLERHQLEYDLTWRYFEKYLPSEGTILEVGAATGRYTLELAKRGYSIAAVDLSSALLEECKKNLAGLDRQVRYLVADARDLSEVTKTDYDAVLLMGPLYHLIDESDRKAALKQAFDRLRPGGVIFSAWISRYGILGDMLRNVPAWIEAKAEVQWLLEKGRRPDDQPRGGFRGYFAEVPEIAPLHEEIGFDTVVVAGIEPAISADDDSYNNVPERYRQQWLDVLYAISTEPSTLGASRHLLYIGRKP